MTSETVKYQDESGFLRHFKVSTSNPRNLVVGDKFIIIGQSKKAQVVESDKQAKKMNESIVTGDKIRKVYE
jgi:hypothetical protein